MTYTVADLEVSARTYREIKKKLKDAGYDHAISLSGIDMTHIRLVKADPHPLVPPPEVKG